MNQIVLNDTLEIEKNGDICCELNSKGLINTESDNIKAGIIGCGAIAQIIADFASEGKLGVDIKFFYDLNIKKAKKMASKIGGTATSHLKNMLNHVDIVIEAASPQAVVELVPSIISRGKDVIIMSIGALIDPEFKNHLKTLAMENNSKIYTPSGAIVGLDGIKAASVGKITEVKLITRKPPQSLGISVDEKTVLYEGKASDAVKKFPVNMNVAAALSIACDKEADVKIIADPAVKHNIHDVHVVGDFGEFKTTTQNRSCASNPKTSVLAAYSAIKLLKDLNENSRIGT